MVLSSCVRLALSNRSYLPLRKLIHGSINVYQGKMTPDEIVAAMRRLRPLIDIKLLN